MAKPGPVIPDRNLMLVNAVKAYPCLYNFSIPEYMRKEVTDEAWLEVANTLQMSVHECKEKWRNLRYSFLRSLKLHPDGSSKKKYYLHNEMEFLVPFMKTRFEGAVVVPQFDDDDEVDESIETNNTEVTNGEEITVEELPNHLEYCSLEFPPEPPTKRRRGPKRSKDNIVCPRKMFLLGLLPEINSLTEVQMKAFRRKVLKLLDVISQDKHDVEIESENTEILEHTENVLKNALGGDRSGSKREFITTIKAEPL